MRFPRIAAGVLAFFVHVSASVATPILITDSDGQLLGANGIAVGGNIFDVTFQEGTCFDLFSGCNSSADFAFATATAAEEASKALLDQVFLDLTNGQFDSEPSLLFGCDVSEACLVFTPYSVIPSAIYLSSASNYPNESDDTSEFRVAAISSDTSASSTSVWAVWNVHAVPEPGTLALFGIGLLGMGAARRRKKA